MWNCTICARGRGARAKRSLPARAASAADQWKTRWRLCAQQTLDLIASFQHAVVGDLMKKTFAAAESLGARRILVTGGVAANRELRARFTAEAAAPRLLWRFPRWRSPPITQP